MAWSEIQKAINTNINEALDVLTKRLIGVNTDVSDTTVFGKLNEKVRPYKQLKLNKVTSPICTASNQPKGVMVDYNSQYYITVQSSPNKLFKIRKEQTGDVIVGSVSLPTNIGSIPIVINDFAFILGQGSPFGVISVDLNALTVNNYAIPTTSSGAITAANTKNQHFDVRFVSGDQYQCLIWVDGATADGIIVCTLDTTATSGATMAQVSFNSIGVAPSATSACCFGINGDTNYYYKNSTGAIDKATISSGSASSLIAITDLQLLDSNSFRSCQTSDYLVLQVKPTTGNGLADVIMVKKSDGSFNYCGVANEETTSIFVPCQIKNADYCVFANSQQVVAIKNDKTVLPILKSQDNLCVNSIASSTVWTNGIRYEGILNHDIANNKITLSGACYYDTTTLANVNTFAIREYDIV